MTASFPHDPVVDPDAPVPGSDRSFGLVFAAVFALIALAPLISGSGLRFWALGVSAAFVGLSLLRPGLLHPLNLIWFRFGMVLHRVMSPLIMGIIFFGAVLPTGLILRALGKDVLRLRRDPAASSYWIARVPPGPASGTMSRQF